MLRHMYFALKKDFTEYLRRHYNILFSMVALAICCGVFASTMFLPRLLEVLSVKRPELVQDSQSMADFLLKLFPPDLRGNVGTVVSDFCLFYSVVIILATFGMVPNEIEGNRWLTPLLCGYTKSELLISKCVIYGLGASAPVVLLTIIYYAFAASFFTENLTFWDTVVFAAIVGLIEFCLCTITISLSAICKHSITAAVSVLGIVYAVPDILNYLSFGKMLPTYLFTYIYSFSTEYSSVIIPAIGLICISAFCVLYSIAKLQRKTL